MIKKPLTDAEIDRIMANVKTTLELDGRTPSDFATEVGKRYLRGEITSEQAIELIKNNILRGSNHENG